MTSNKSTSTKQQSLTFSELKEVFYSTSNAFREAFPGFNDFNRYDLTLGLIFLAQKHVEQNLLQLHLENIEPPDKPNRLNINKYNPDCVSIDTMYKFKKFVELSNLVYLPEKYSTLEVILVLFLIKINRQWFMHKLGN